MVITGLASRHSRVCLVIVLWLFLGDDTLAEMDLKSDDSTSLCVAFRVPSVLSTRSLSLLARLSEFLIVGFSRTRVWSIKAINSIRYI